MPSVDTSIFQPPPKPKGPPEGDGSDYLVGTPSPDRLYGLGGDDTLVGLASNDLLVGGDDNDTLLGGTGADRLYGGTGFDTASYAGEAAVKVVMPDSTQHGGAAEGDIFPGIEEVIGSSYNDHLVGDDEVRNLVGGAGKDFLYGWNSASTLTGGSGSDTFYFSLYYLDLAETDVVKDFTPGSDKIRPHLQDKPASAYEFVGTASFDAGPPDDVQVRYAKSGGDTVVQIDRDADAAAEGQVVLKGFGGDLHASDFIFG